jgi:hypothetical protein
MAIFITPGSRYGQHVVHRHGDIGDDDDLDGLCDAASRIDQPGIGNPVLCRQRHLADSVDTVGSMREGFAHPVGGNGRVVFLGRVRKPFFYQPARSGTTIFSPVTSGEKGSQFFRFGGSQYRLPSDFGRRSASLPGIKGKYGGIAAENKKTCLQRL